MNRSLVSLLRALIHEYSERHGNRADQCRESGRVSTVIDQVETNSKRSHCEYERKHLSEDGDPSNRAVVALAVTGIIFSHRHDSIRESWLNSFVRHQFFCFRNWGDAQLAAVRDHRLVALLKLALLALELPVAFTLLRQALLLQTGEKAVDADRPQSSCPWHP